MTTIPLYGGPLKRVLIERAYGLCGQSTTEYELTPEEYALGLQAANSVAGTLGATFPWNAPIHGDGSSEDESGLPAADVLGFTAMLAQEVAPNIERKFQPNGQQARAMSSLRAKYSPVPYMQLGRQTPRGTGNRHWGRRAYFVADTAADEPIQ